MTNANKLSEFLRWSLMIFIILGFRTIVFISIIIFIMLQVQSWLHVSYNTGILKQLYSVMVNRIRASDPRGLNKGRSSKFHVGFWVWQETPEEGWRTHQPKRCEYNNKDKDYNPKTLNDKNADKFSRCFMVEKFTCTKDSR